jgi:hypothetical protein
MASYFCSSFPLLALAVWKALVGAGWGERSALRKYMHSFDAAAAAPLAPAPSPSDESSRRKSGAGADGASSAGAGDAIVSQLEKLAKLHQMGALDDSEYTTAKSKLLAAM